MPRIKKVYQVTDSEVQIFQESERDPNVFTDWYLRGPNTGTWLSPNADDSRLKARYKEVHKLWKKKLLPERMRFEWEEGIHDVVASYKVGYDQPFFHIEHGFLYNTWQKIAYLAPQETIVIMGGFGGGKTIYGIVDMLIKAATLPGFLGLVIAPYSDQSKEVFDKATDIVQGTRYQERFMPREWRERPHPTLFINNSLVGESRIDFRSLLDDTGKVLNLERDMAMIDQAEQLPNIVETRRAVATRLRGFYQGRERVGKTIYIANPYENPEIWDLYDEMQEDPENVLAIQVSTYENTTGLSEKQVKKFERAVGKTDDDKSVYLKGNRPIGDGKQFPRATVAACKSDMLDDLMKKGLEEKTPGYLLLEAPRVGIYQWELPPVEGGEHITIADPGWANPPNRNSAVIGVWNVAGFPEIPAQMRAFSWVPGNGSPEPWMNRFYEYVMRYKTITRAAYDSSGWQSGYERWVNIFKDLKSEGMNLNASSKFGYLNAGKILMSKGLIQFPSIDGIISQLAKYDIPDEKIRQDIVMMLILTCGWLERKFYMRIRDLSNDQAMVTARQVQTDRNFRSAAIRERIHRR